MKQYGAVALLSMHLLDITEAFVHPVFPVKHAQVRRSILTKHSMFSAALTSILAGSVAGAVGVGVAYPFDSLKTKAQLQQANNMFQTIASVYQEEGIAGFFSGVKASTWYQRRDALQSRSS
jgi:ABC-type uncharacterized transport system permease subunit